MLDDPIPLTRIEKYLYYLWKKGGGGGNVPVSKPHRIKVDTPPTKTEYEKGETIDFTGIVVKIYNQDDSLWTSKKYPDGVAPFNELVFPVTIATKETE